MTLKFDDHFGLLGSIEVDAYYKIAGLTYKLPLDGSGNATKTASVKWDSFDSIEMFVNVEYKLSDQSLSIKNPMGTMGVGRFGISARWLASFSAGGVELAQDGSQPKVFGTNKSDGDIAVAASARLAESKPGAKTPFVEMAVATVIGFQDDGIQVGLGKGSVSVGVSLGGHKASSGSELALRINLEMDRPAVPVKIVVERIPPSLLTPAPILFKEDEDTLSSQSTRELHEWVSKVKDHQYLGAVIAKGTLPIEIQAFASTTGSPTYNKGETDRRLDSVEKILKSSQFFGSSTLKFDEKSHGKEKAEGTGAKYGFNRRVEIKIDNNKATKAGEQFLSAK